MSLDASVTHTDTGAATYSDTLSDLLAPQSCSEHLFHAQLSDDTGKMHKKTTMRNSKILHKTLSNLDTSREPGAATASPGNL